ncbi:MAG: type Z 30S ribosomal protein S14 [Myxococcales bacterium]|nr:type Z 30S ribosomal protein S14 [Myxococcales bacterium]MCZ6713821.1 type Z 30S ribosomal protein S14 [Deltaproteobacteria bacterium]MCZ6823746.1 type Z 30S ribosomal protein S14 [Deltaproteobacteria bacterium]TDJ02638.1 MAG: type Z 30S ribosomal protein S14 [Deltaproteobacteria bacterium]TDJ07017.1 MAG: type Z 30S ribosomal protein S14 [Deltaproteobacteria bacterium]
MPKLSNRIKQRRLREAWQAGKLKFRSRYYNRCGRCGRARGYYRRFDLCRICLRMLALEGKIPGMTKSSW